jgi:hypothetical protein
MRSESKARFRRPRRVEVVSVQSNFLPSSAVSQFPTRTPSRLTPFTRRMPAARSGLRSPQSDASYASRRIAANLRLIVDGAYGRCSSAIRYRVTTVLLKAILGSEQYHSMNSRMAWSYERFELADVSLFKTAHFDCSRSGNLRTVLGTRLRVLFAIGRGLRCRGDKHLCIKQCNKEFCNQCPRSGAVRWHLRSPETTRHEASCAPEIASRRRWSSRSDLGHAAIDDQFDAGDIATFVRSEK